MTTARQIVEAVLALLAAGGFFYLLLAIYSAVRFRRSLAGGSSGSSFPVSILKPLKGADPDMYESFRSHCRQEYDAPYEIIFGVNDASDEAVKDVERLRREFPDRDIKLMVCPEVLGSNRKVSNLARMVREAKYEHVLVNDADIQVPPDYLRRVMAHFQDSSVGMVTALYRGVPSRTPWSYFEAASVADFAAGVLSAIIVDQGLKFALGSTLAIRRDVLKKIGGFEALVNHLADDYELGFRTAKAGHKVELADTVVKTVLPPYSFRQMYEHQMRWARTMRDLRKSGYVGTLFTYALTWAVLCAVVAWSGWAVGLLVAVAVARLLSAFLVTCILGGRFTIRNILLIPLRDFLGVLIFFGSFAGNTVVWRGETFHLRDGILHRN